MTFDDGIMKFYSVENIAAAGNKPKTVLKYKTTEKYTVTELGVTRFYYALQNNQQIDSVICTYQNRNIRVNDIAVDEFKNQFLIRMIQESNEDGLKFLKISLERLAQNYEVLTDC